MAITVVGKTSHGTFEQIVTELRQLNDEYEMLEITVSFKRPRKPLIRLVVDSSAINEIEGDKP